MSADEPSAPVRITQREIYDLLVAIDKKLDPLPARIEDHETRLRTLEAAVAKVPEPAPRLSGWQIAGVVISGLVGIGGVIGLALTLIQATSNA